MNKSWLEQQVQNEKLKKVQEEKKMLRKIKYHKIEIKNF